MSLQDTLAKKAPAAKKEVLRFTAPQGVRVFTNGRNVMKRDEEGFFAPANEEEQAHLERLEKSGVVQREVIYTEQVEEVKETKE